jgi:norsolorinic acid ketoreductase
VEALVQRPNTTVIAGVRNREDESSKTLSSVLTATGSKIIILTIDNNSDSSAKVAIEYLQTQYNITKLDTVIANAGISKYYGLAIDTPVKEVREHFEVNAIGTLLLFQATADLLKRSSDPIFVGISTGAASIGEMGKIPLNATAYGISKVALNYLVRKIHFENPDITAFVLSPG